MDCHAPEQNYMVIDGRHDHSFRLPRPDLSLSLVAECLHAVPSKEQTRMGGLQRWIIGTAKPGVTVRITERPTSGSDARSQGFAGATRTCPGFSHPAIVRATALTLVAPLMAPEFLTFARQQLKDPDPSVRIAALGLIESVDTINRVLAATPLLTDPVRGVRMEPHVFCRCADSQMTSGRLSARRAR